jgi:hypothetical protein
MKREKYIDCGGSAHCLGASPSLSNDHQLALAELFAELDFDSTDELIADAIENGETYGICMRCRHVQHRVDRTANGVECEECEEHEVISGEVLIAGNL